MGGRRSGFRIRVAVVAAVVGVASGLIGALVASPAGATTVVHCPTDNLQTAIAAAPPGSTIAVSGTCTGQFTILKDLTLVGPATLDGIADSTMLRVDFGVTVTLDFLTIQHANATIDGGGIFNLGTLTLNASQVSNNTTRFGRGGGIFNLGTLTLNASQVSNNTAPEGSGGGIFSDNTVTLNSSSVSNNTTGGVGGGIANDGTATLTATIVTNNSASDGGGIFNENTVNLLASLVFLNHPNNCAGSNSVPGCIN
jgi:predicted outer membrane repeat protein